jgi:hypothetical protein
MDGNTGDVSGRGVKSGYWFASQEPGGVTVTLGCNKNGKFWATVRLTRAELVRLLELAAEVPAEPGEGLTDAERAEISL